MRCSSRAVWWSYPMSSIDAKYAMIAKVVKYYGLHILSGYLMGT
jgi:hypothetical protein